MHDLAVIDQEQKFVEDKHDFLPQLEVLLVAAHEMQLTSPRYHLKELLIALMQQFVIRCFLEVNAGRKRHTVAVGSVLLVQLYRAV